MNVNCQSCGAKYAIADNKVQGRKVKVRCKSCSTTIVVDGTAFNAEAGVQIGNVVLDPKTLDGSELSPFVGEGAMWSVSVTDDDQREMTADQIVAAFRAGQFNDATFIWKEGMDDWKPLLNVPEFQSLAAPAPKPVAAGIPRPAAAAVQAAAPAAFPPAPAAFAAAPAAAAPAAKGALPQAPGRVSTLPQAPARASTLPRPRISNTKDLFSTTAAPEEEIATAPAPQVSNSTDATGSRNESSVLFSLDALKRQSTAPPAPSKAKSDDPFGLGSLGGGGGGLGGFGGGGSLFTPDAHALLTAPAAAPPPSAQVVRSAAPGSFDLATPPQKKKSPLIWIIPVVAIAIGGGAFAMFGGKGESAKPESGETSATNSGDRNTKAAEEAKAKADEEKKAEEAKAKADEEKKAEEAKAKADEEKKAEEAKGSTQASAPSTVSARAAATHTSDSATTAAASPKSAKAAKPKAEEAAPAGGGSTFNVGAAKAALAAAAGQAPSCKKSGQGGSGKATVTFAPSGGASSVTISGISGFASNCVSGLFRKARVPAFSGAPVTVSKGFKIPE